MMVDLIPSISGETSFNSKMEKVAILVYSTEAPAPFTFLSGMPRDERVRNVNILPMRAQEYAVILNFLGKLDIDIDWMFPRMEI